MAGAVHTLKAYNTAKASENKIHDDAVAKRFGFTGGFVPGTEVYAYMAHVPASRWGQRWLEAGTMTAHFHKPVYDGAPVEIFVSDAPDLSIAVRCVSAGVDCADAVAGLAPSVLTAPDAGAMPRRTLPDLADRAAASPQTLAAGTVLGTYALSVSRADLDTYLEEISETVPFYAAEGLVPSSIFLRMANWALSSTVKMGPWIHVSSTVQHFAAGLVDEPMEARPVVCDAFERKGHRFVDLDVGVFGAGGRALARVTHTAIYEPRQIRGA